MKYVLAFALLSGFALAILAESSCAATTTPTEAAQTKAALYATELQLCIAGARLVDGGYDARLKFYNDCANGIDAGAN